MTLRQKIQTEIEKSGGDAEKAALDICKLLEDNLDLAGNGWFDDDPELLEQL